MIKEKRILSYFISWLILGLFICFIGISNTYALVIDSSFLGYSNNGNFGISAGNYVSGNSFITVDQSNALNYYVVDMCTTLNNLFTITNITNQSGNVSLYKTYSYLGSCNTDNYTGQLSRIYFKINQWADAGNGNFGVIFSARLNNIANYYGDNKIINIYTTNEIDNTSDIINNQTNELNNSINNSTNTITGSIGDAENNINSNINDMEQSIVDSNKETQDVIKDQFNSCRDSKNLFDAYNITFGTPHNSSYIINDSNSITVTNNGGWSRVYATINGLKPNTFYTISADMINNNNIPAGLWINDNNNNLQYNDSRVVVRTTSNGSIDFQFYTNWNSTPNYGQVIYNNIQIEEGSSATTFEKPGEICTNKLDEQNNKLNDINGSLNNSDSTGATNDASNFFSNFSTDTFGLTSIITAPLNIINSITSSSCNDLNLPLPYLDNKYITLPCMNSIYTRYFGVFFNLYQTITFGIVSYWVIVRIFNQVKDFKNPEHDEIEVLDL